MWLDPAGFAPAQGRRVLSALRTIAGIPPLTSPDGDLFFFDLRPYRQRLGRTHTAAELAALATRTLHPLRAACAPGGLAVSNPATRPDPATLTVYLTHGRVIARRVLLAPGRTVVRLTSLQAASEQVRYATLTDSALASLPLAPIQARMSWPDSQGRLALAE